MKATKTKPAGRPKKTTKAVETGIKKEAEIRAKSTVKKTSVRKAAVKKSIPSEDQIRQKAYELYHLRVSRGESGNEMDDWIKAIKSIQK